MEELLKSLIHIQQNLNAPKSQYNNFGKFNYRSLEDIEASIKPLLAEQHCGIRFSDEVVDHCGRTFLRTTLTFFNEKGQSLSTTAEAEHAAEKTGMDAAQITGAASSYARKYAMNAMFAIDDNKDADTDEFHQQTTQEKPNKRTYTRRTTTAAAPVEKYGHIKAALQAATTTDALLALYNQHRQEVEGNPEVKALFTQRRQQLQTKQAA